MVSWKCLCTCYILGVLTSMCMLWTFPGLLIMGLKTFLSILDMVLPLEVVKQGCSGKKIASYILNSNLKGHNPINHGYRSPERVEKYLLIKCRHVYFPNMDHTQNLRKQLKKQNKCYFGKLKNSVFLASSLMWPSELYLLLPEWCGT